MAYPEDLPGTPVEGEEDHIPDHEILNTTVGNIDERLHAVEVELPNKAATHSHPYAATSHTHIASNVTDFNTAVRTNRLDQMTSPTAPVGMGSQRITGLGAPSAATDAATKAYVDASGGGSPVVSNVIVATDYGAIGDGRIIAVTTTASSTTVAPWDPTNLFSAADVGKKLWINAAGTSGGVHICTISSYSSGTATITVTPAPVATVSAGAVCGTDNTSAFNAWCAAATPWSMLRLPAAEDGNFYMSLGGHVIPDLAVTVFGDNKWLSQIITPSSDPILTFTNHIAKVNSMGFQHVAGVGNNLGLTNGSYPWEGAAVKISNGSSSLWSGEIVDCNALNLYRGFWAEGSYMIFRNNYVTGHQRAGIELHSPEYPDWGVYLITQNYISSGGPGGNLVPYAFAGIIWRGSGGLHISENWIDGGRNHVYLKPDGASGTTGNIRIDGNSLEDWGWGGSGNAVQYDMHLTNAYQAYIVITNNTLQTQMAKTDPAFKLFAASNPSPDSYGNYGLRAISISGNAGKFSGYLADLSRCRDVSVTGNTVMGKIPADMVTQVNCTNVTIA